MEVRHQVIDAIVEAFTSNDASALPPGATAEEREAADTAIGRLLERQPERDPRGRSITLLFRSYRSGDDWNDLLDRLTPFEVAELHDLFPYMPARPARFFAERFLFPTA